MAKQAQVKQALDAIPEAKGLMRIVEQAAREIKLDPIHVVRVAATSLRLNPQLAKCTPASFIGSLIALEQVGLEPVAGRAYLLPFLNKRSYMENNVKKWRHQLEVQALIGYKGYCDLFYRHEAALSIEAHEVHKNDHFEYEYGTNAFLKHKPVLGDRGPVLQFYCIAKMKAGGALFLVMSKDECIAHGKKHSKVYDKQKNQFIPGTPWVTEEDAMCKKTVLLQMTKNLPLSIETQRALSIDETTREYRPGVGDMISQPDVTSWESEPEEPPIDVTPEPEKNPLTQSSLPPNVLESIKKAQEKVGKEISDRVLGELGYETAEQIPDIATANKVLAKLSKEYSSRQK